MLVLLCSAGCQLTDTYVRQDGGLHPAPAPTLSEVESSIILIGDVGNAADRHGHHLLKTLTEEIRRYHPGQTLVVFLGDNIYPGGLREREGILNPEDVSRLSLQIEAVKNGGGHAVFLPGNHDYDAGGTAGVLRQEAYINRFGVIADGRRVARFCPADAAPGPEFLDWGDQIRLVCLNTQWWFQGRDRLGQENRPVNDKIAPEQVIADLVTTIEEARDRYVVVAGHHPLESNGPHGGFFPWHRHLFPLRQHWKGAWVPLPVFGTIYVVARQLGVYDTEGSHSQYKKLCARIEKAFQEVSRAPLVYAAGHEHSLEVLKGTGALSLIVSGAGSPAECTPLSVTEETLMASPHPGFFRLDILHDGRVRLEMIEVDSLEPVRRGVAVWLRSKPKSNHSAR